MLPRLRLLILLLRVMIRIDSLTVCVYNTLAPNMCPTVVKEGGGGGSLEIVTQANITRMRTPARVGLTPNKRSARFTDPNGRTSVADTVVFFLLC